jgi:hypothetical protein
MELKDSIKSGFEMVSETVSEVASIIAEKNRLRTQLNHLKTVIKGDSATRDQAYIELGRFFYENLREGASPENEAICAVIDASSERITRASIKYAELLNMQNELHIRTENTERIKKALAERAAVAADAAKEKSAELSQKAKAAAADYVEKAKDAVTELRDKAADTVEDVKDRLNIESSVELEELIAEEQRKMQEAETSAEEPAGAPAEEPAEAPEAEVPAEEPAEAPAETPADPALTEESPESFDF